jgi:hypothetical protein
LLIGQEKGDLKCPWKWICSQATGDIFLSMANPFLFPVASNLSSNLDKIAEL